MNWDGDSWKCGWCGLVLYGGFNRAWRHVCWCDVGRDESAQLISLVLYGRRVTDGE